MSLEEFILRHRQGKIITKKMPLSQEIKRSIYWLIFTLLTLIVPLAIVFLLNTSQASQKGYIIRKQQLDKEEFLLKSRELLDKIIEAQSFKSLENSDIVKGMQKPENPIYLEPKK